MHAYATDVVAGRIVAGPHVRLACQRHLRDLETGAARGLRFHEGLASDIIEFFPKFLRLAEGDFAGKPFVLTPAWQFIVGSLFGWLGPDGYRRFTTGYIEQGKGNGKTPTLAGIGLYGLLFDDEPGAHIYCAAVTAEQARIMFSDSLKMAKASTLAPRLMINVNNIADLGTQSFMRPVSSEGRSLDGKRVHMGLIDEIHEHLSAEVVEKLRAGTKGRRQGLILEITNAGYDRTSVCWQHHSYSIDLLNGLLDNDAWFAYVCALDDQDDPLTDEACWIKANPNLDVSVPRKYIRQRVDEAKGMPAKLSDLMRLNFCVWAQKYGRLIPMDAWALCGAAVPAADLAGVPCWGGVDLGYEEDLSAFAVVSRLADGRVAVRMRFWIPGHQVMLRPERYEPWVRAGLLTVTEGTTTDYDLIEREIAETCKAWQVRDVGYDPRFAEQMALHLRHEFGDSFMVAATQGFKLNEALVELVRLTKDQKLCHGGHPILTWNADNVVARHGHYGEVRLDKAQASEKIDGISALANALDRMIRTPYPGSIYDERAKRGEPMLTLF